MEEAQFTLSQQGKQILLDKLKYEYKKKSTYKDRIYWECRLQDIKKCTATAVTILAGEKQFIKEIKGSHCHSSNLVKKRVQAQEMNCVENAAKNPTVACRTILSDLSNTLQTDSTAAASSMAKLGTLKQRIYRARYVYNIKTFSKKNFKMQLDIIL